MNVVFWIVFGTSMGIIANALDPQPSQGGIMGAIVLGVAGAFLGGIVANIVVGTTGTPFSFTTFAVGLLGSLLLLLMGRAVRKT